MKTKRISTAVQRWGRYALTLLLACALMAGLAMTAAAREGWQGEVVDPAIPKPTVTIQGNLVVEKGKPTGFYELALCVRSGRTIVGPDPTDWTTVKELTEAEYAAALAAIEAGDVGAATAGVTENSYTLTYYPFRTATAAVNINADVLTAVDWAIQSVSYENYDATLGEYPSDATNLLGYRRGIDTDPKTQGYDTLGITEAQAFPDITTPNLQAATPAVAIDVEGDSRMFAATGQVDHYDLINRTALVTLSAQAPTNRPVILTEDTLLVVARFSYDLKRFPDVKVNDSDWSGDERNSASGSYNDTGFWLGWDKRTVTDAAANITSSTGLAAKTPLTWLGESDSALVGQFDFTDSDRMAAMTRMGQSVWVHMETGSGKVEDLDTYFYYYLGAEDNQNLGQASQLVNDNGTPTQVPGITQPKTAGLKVLTKGDEENPVPSTPPATQAQYTYFKNLLRLKDRTLAVELVNHETFKKPSGVGGNQILFYDWDDTLLGALIVGDGDVREEVNAYVERNMVHPDLRAGDILNNKLGGTLPDFSVTPAAGSDAEEYQNILNSLDREWTYRGKYSSKVDGTGVVRDEAGENPGDPNSVPGKEYKLTNKIDYAFYRHLDTVTTVEYQDAGGSAVTERYITTEPLTSNADAALYPWVYGWAIVEDNSARNRTDWQVRRDATQLENTWTTFGVGELSGLEPSYDMAGNQGVQAVPTALPAGTTTVPGTTLGGGTGLETTYPAFVDTTTIVAPPTDYAYMLSSADADGYLRFADFSDMKSQFSKSGQNVLVVKAVYEPGPELMEGFNHQMIKEPYYNKLRNEAANNGGAYSIQVTLERASREHPDGMVRGVSRVREAVVRQDTTADQKWIEDAAKSVSHDLENASKNIARSLGQTTFTKVDIDNGEEITFTLALSPRQHRVDYWIIDAYGFNFAAGGQRSETNYERTGTAFALDNYNYYMAGESDEGDIYYDPVDYADRDGSRGFVLYGTLNRMMQLATYVSRGGSDSDFIIGVAFDTMNDANLRSAGGDPADVANETDIQDAILAAALACESAGYYGKTDFWNSELDCAELTYHQLQHFICGKGLMTRADADADKISWCHLHKDCAAESAGVPKNWEQIITAAKAGDTAALEKMMLGDITSITNLRADGAGNSAFVVTPGAPDNFANRITAAVQTLDAAGAATTWDNVQYVLLNPGAVPADDSYARENFWWYDSITTTANISPANLKALTNLAQIANTDDATLLPDGVTPIGKRTAKLRAALGAFNANNDGTDEVGILWNRATENLVANRIAEADGSERTEKFADWDSFEAALLKAVEVATKAGVTTDSDTDYWWKLQYLILHPSETAWPTASVGDGSAVGDELAGYWWHYGGKHLFINNLRSLLDVAAMVNDSDLAAQAFWNTFPLTEFQKCNDMTDFALNFVGTDKIDDLEVDGSTAKANEFSDFKDKILALDAFCRNNTWLDITSNNTNLWKDVQFWILHETSEVKPGEPAKEYQYYWWEQGGAPAPLNLVGSAGNVRVWLNAAFAEVFNGNTVSWDKITANEADGVSNKAFNNTRLRNPAAEDVTPGNTTYQKVEEIPVLPAADIKTKMNALIVDVMTGKTGHSAHTPPTTVTWYQVQDYLITGIYTGSPTADQKAAWEKQYWWLDLDENPDKAQVDLSTPVLDKFIADYISPTNKVSTITNAALTSNSEGELKFKKTTGQGGFTTPPLLNAGKTRLNNLLTAATAAGQDLSTLTWYQIQWALLDDGNGAYLTPNQAYHACKDLCTWAPDWVKKLPEPPAPEALNKFIATYFYPDNKVSTVTNAALTSNDMGELKFKKTTSQGGFTTPPLLNAGKTRLNSLLTAAGAAGQDLRTLTWYQIQYALMDEGNGAYLSPLDAYNWGKDLCIWAPPCATTAAVPEGASLLWLEGEDASEVTAEETVLEKLSDDELDALIQALLEEKAKREDVGADVPIGPTTNGDADVGADVPSGPATNTPQGDSGDSPSVEQGPTAPAGGTPDPYGGTAANGSAAGTVPLSPAIGPATNDDANYGEVEEIPLGEDAHPAAAMTAALCWKPQCDWRTALMA